VIYIKFNIYFQGIKVSLTKYGLPQVAIYPGMLLLLMAVLFFAGPKFTNKCVIISVEAILLVVLVWVLAFFRDPVRAIPAEKGLILSPADGTVSNVEIVENCEEIGGRAMRIGIFLSIFNVHINRAPCAVKIGKISYKKGYFKNAMSAESAKVNESNNILMTRTDEPFDKLVLRQISGAIARRIVCDTREGDVLSGGEKFGMIKFGSRTELYYPLRENARCEVKVGDKVKAGSSILVRYE